MAPKPVRFVVLFLLFCAHPLQGQVPYASGELQLALEKLTVLGSVLYVSAHPDDENTAYLATMAKAHHLRTGYLALTRGEGGQNLIGPEQGEALGVIRTEELLGARRIDGAEQFFTRAIDFGYTKSTDEALAFWGKEEILSDIVWVIRSFRPDVIVTRFTPERGGHGHHTASAVLADEAYRAAADSGRFTEQLRFVRPWHARRIVWNVFRFSDRPGETAQAPSVTEDLGVFSPLLGLSMGEVAGRSRSMHRSQGFGAMERRGIWTNSFEHVDGDTARQTLLDGIDLSWNRVPGGRPVGKLLRQAADSFDHRNPSTILPLLLEALHLVDHLRDDPWISVKRRELVDAILGATGLWVEAIAAADRAVAGTAVDVELTVLNRSTVDVRLERFGMTYAGEDTLLDRAAELNRPLVVSLRADLPDTLAPSQPYWLVDEPLRGRYRVRELQQIGRPQNDPVLQASVVLRIAGRRVAVETPVRYRRVDPARGERSSPFAVVPPVSVSVNDPVVVSVGGQEKELSVVVSGALAAVAGTVRLHLPSGWTASPAFQEVRVDTLARERTVTFRLTPGEGARPGMVAAEIQVGDRRYDRALRSISYDHIEPQVLFEPARARLLPLDLRTAGTHLGYIVGSGDAIPDLLGQLGYTVELLSDAELETGDLGRFDAIVAGVRAYNVRPALRSANHRLMEYIHAGGRYIVQYVTMQELDIKEIGPYPFSVSRSRVSVEDAPVTFLEPAHPLLTDPNPITAEDFQGWVQERGLYFAGEWDPRYETPLASNDPGEAPLAGGLLFGRYGKGYFVYSGYSWFRQLPAGVPGAFRLFVNLLSQEVGS